MDISTPVLAILIAICSLALSLHTSVSTRRASQLQRLAAIRTKLSSLMWKIQFDLSLVSELSARSVLVANKVTLLFTLYFLANPFNALLDMLLMPEKINRIKKRNK